MKNLALLLLLLLAPSLKAQDTSYIVNWHTLKVTANYEQDVKATKSNEYLFVWVGDTVDYKVFAFLEEHKVRQSYAPSLAGTKPGLLIGKGQNVYKFLDLYTLSDSKTLTQLEFLVHEPQTVVLEPKLKLVVTQQLVVKQLGMHKHQCGNCGTVWAHNAGGSHTCPNCGSGPWLYHYQGNRPAQYIH